MNRFTLPLILFGALVILLAVGLRLNPREVPSPLIGKPAPLFNLPHLADPNQHFSPADMKGRVWLFNVWASWCVSCRQEHEVLLDFAKTNLIPIVGLDYKDNRDDGLRWLKQLGDPYFLTAYDRDGRVGIDYGVYGVPESYVIDQAGIIRYKQIGPVTPEALKEKIVPLIKELQK